MSPQRAVNLDQLTQIPGGQKRLPGMRLNDVELLSQLAETSAMYSRKDFDS